VQAGQFFKANAVMSSDFLSRFSLLATGALCIVFVSYLAKTASSVVFSQDKD
jgi:hypothetical protein